MQRVLGQIDHDRARGVDRKVPGQTACLYLSIDAQIHPTGQPAALAAKTRFFNGLLEPSQIFAESGSAVCPSALTQGIAVSLE